MKDQDLKISVKIQITKTPSQVFDAIINPEKMSNYFISESTGIMEEGKTVIWKFPEFEEEAPVNVKKIEKNKLITFTWETEGNDHLVIIKLDKLENDQTLLHITEEGGKLNDKGIAWLQGNTEGWANFAACLKAYLEYGINLRKCAFDFMKK